SAGYSDHRPGRARGTLPRRHWRALGMAADSADVVGLQESGQRPHAGEFPARLRALRLRARPQHGQARLSVAADRSVKPVLAVHEAAIPVSIRDTQRGQYYGPDRETLLQ